MTVQKFVMMGFIAFAGRHTLAPQATPVEKRRIYALKLISPVVELDNHQSYEPALLDAGRTVSGFSKRLKRTFTIVCTVSYSVYELTSENFII